jgi:hypothetical protein
VDFYPFATQLQLFTCEPFSFALTDATYSH